MLHAVPLGGFQNNFNNEKLSKELSVMRVKTAVSTDYLSFLEGSSLLLFYQL